MPIPHHAGLLLIAFGMSVAVFVPWAVAAREPEPRLQFVDPSGETHTLTLSALRAVCDEEDVEVVDPYHQRAMRYVAMALRCVLDIGFERSGGAEGLRKQGLLLRALDGYSRPVRGEDLLEPGAFLAFGEAGLIRGKDALPRFAKIDRRGIDPGPFYLVWSEPGQNDAHLYPWPYQLAEIEIAPFEREYPKTEPLAAPPESAARRGFAIFRRECVSCHSINGEGGKIGPDLNIPMSIVEYRPVAQIQAFIRDPNTFRRTSMPPHRHLTDDDLDDLIAYFTAMKSAKFDPEVSGH